MWLRNNKVWFLLLAGFLIINCSLRGNAYAQDGVANMKKVVMIIPAQGYRDEELNIPKQILQANGAQVRIASATINLAKGMLGASVKPDMLLNDVDVSDFDAVVFVGGMGAEQYFNNPLALQIARDAYNDNRIIAAICIAPVILANAGILQGKRATVSASESGLIKARGARYTGGQMERDGKIITASGPSAAADFANELVAALNE